MTAWWSVRVTTNLDSLNPSVSRADFFILRGTCKTRCYIIKKQGRSRCFNDQKNVWFSQSHSVCNDGYYGYRGRHVFIVNVWDYAKNSTSSMVDVKYHISWKVNSQTANTYDEDLVSFIKDRVLSPNALQQVTVGLQCIKSFSLLTQKGQNCSKITLHLIISAFLFKSVADICHFLSFDRFRIKPLVLNYKEYVNNMYVICYHIIHTFSTMCYK